MACNNPIAVERKRRGMSQVELAKAIGVTRDAVGDWETGVHPPSSAHQAALKDVLSLSDDDLWRAAHFRRRKTVTTVERRTPLW